MKYQSVRFDESLPKSISANTFIIEEISADYFQLSLYKLKHSLWWNVHGFFFIKNIQAFDSCKSAYFFLKMIWELNILNAVFLCHDLNVGITLYTFNPYSASAPQVWKKVENYVQENGHPFTLFKILDHAIGKCLENVYVN